MDLSSVLKFDPNQPRDDNGRWASDGFKDWFGKSHIVEADGSPKTVYHGTTSDFDTFTRVEGGNMWGPGHYLTTDPNTASGYALGTAGGRIAPEGNAGANVMPVYLSVQNPFKMTATLSKETLAAVEKIMGESLKEYTWSGMKNRDLRQVLFEQFTDQEGANKILEKAGFDALIESSITSGPGETIMVFKPQQIKSAIGNQGTFDKKDPRITKWDQVLKFDPNQPRDERGRWTDGSSYYGSSGRRLGEGFIKDEKKRQAVPHSPKTLPKKGDKLIVYRIGSSTGNTLENRNGGDVIGVLDFLDDALEHEGFVGGANPLDNIHVFEVEFTKDVTDDYVAINRGRDSSRAPKVVGSRYRYGGHSFSFRKEGSGGYKSKHLMTLSTADVMEKLPGYPWTNSIYNLGVELETMVLENLKVKKFDPSQPRDERGRWTDSGGATGSYTPNEAVQLASQEVLSAFKENKLENLVVLGPNGERLMFIEGQTHSVPLTESEKVRIPPGSHLVHNHPGPKALSPGDLTVAESMGSTITSVDTDGGIYTAKVTRQKSTMYWESFERDYLEIEQDFHDEYLAPFGTHYKKYRTQMPDEAVALLTQHIINLKLHNKGLIDYQYKLGKTAREYIEKYPYEFARMVDPEKAQRELELTIRQNVSVTVSSKADTKDPISIIIDAPITPLSSKEEIQAWLKELDTLPDCEDKNRAYAEAVKLIAQARPATLTFEDILKFDPDQPRDENGRWAKVGVRGPQQELFPELLVEDPARYAIAEDRVVQYRLDERENEIIAVNDEHGSHDYHEVMERLTSLLSTAEIQVAHRTWDTIQQILDDGRVKSQFETGESNGLFDPERRSYIESDLFNMEDDPEYDAENRPVYGTFAGDGGMWTSGLRQYGHIKMIMRPEVSQRTTFTGADSLRMHYDIEQVHFQPSLVKKPYLASLLSVDDLSNPDRIESIMSNVMNAKSASELSDYEYMEVQVHGQIKLSDIARIEIPDDPRYEPSPNTFKQLQELGIPLYAVDNLGNRRLWTT